jgi:hypothetical protein
LHLHSRRSRRRASSGWATRAEFPTLWCLVVDSESIQGRLISHALLKNKIPDKHWLPEGKIGGWTGL